MAVIKIKKYSCNAIFLCVGRGGEGRREGRGGERREPTAVYFPMRQIGKRLKVGRELMQCFTHCFVGEKGREKRKRKKREEKEDEARERERERTPTQHTKQHNTQLITQHNTSCTHTTHNKTTHHSTSGLVNGTKCLRQKKSERMDMCTAFNRHDPANAIFYF